MLSKILLIIFIICFGFGCSTIEVSRRVAVIGAGVSGLTSARYLKEIGANFTVFELTPHPGGTWRFEPRVGNDEYGESIMSSMYKNLSNSGFFNRNLGPVKVNMRTALISNAQSNPAATEEKSGSWSWDGLISQAPANLPKPVMQFPGFPLQKYVDRFPKDEEVYEYLEQFIEYFHIGDYIKYNHKVTKVERINNSWKVTYLNRNTGTVSTEEFDYVIVGSGHSNKPNYPNVPGEKNFTGRIIHSHDYRYPEPYTNKRVLVVGNGPSAVDITIEILSKASKVYISHRGKKHALGAKLPSHLEKKPGLKEFNETGVFFVDGTFAEVDEVIYGTGYQFDFPFLTESCELTLTDKYVGPLHLQVVNINQPTMLVLGCVLKAIFLVAIDAQARYAVSLVSGNFTLPPKEKMMEQWQNKMESIKSQNKSLSEIHWLHIGEEKYYVNLASESGIAGIPPAFLKLRNQNMRAILENAFTFRNYKYTIIDDNNVSWEYAEITGNEVMT